METRALKFPCPHPASEQALLFLARDYITGNRFEIVRCGACGICRTQPQPIAEQWSTYYPAEYYGAPGGNRFPRLVERLQIRLYASRVRRIEQFVNPPGRVLDVGCGRGTLLREFQKRGWEVQGTESSEQAAACARSVLETPIHVGELVGLRFPDEHFDAVVMWHVLEHLPDPQSALAEVARILKPGGVFFVALPNFSSFEAGWAKDKWFHLDVPRHLSHLTFPVLRQQLNAVGLLVTRVSFFAAEYDAFSFTQSMLNRIGLRQNLLFNLLRGAGAKLWHHERGLFWQTLATFLLAPFIGLISLPAIFLAALCRSGATMTIHAQKVDPK